MKVEEHEPNPWKGDQVLRKDEFGSPLITLTTVLQLRAETAVGGIHMNWRMSRSCNVLLSRSLAEITSIGISI